MPSVGLDTDIWRPERIGGRIEFSSDEMVSVSSPTIQPPQPRIHPPQPLILQCPCRALMPSNMHSSPQCRRNMGMRKACSALEDEASPKLNITHSQCPPVVNRVRPAIFNLPMFGTLEEELPKLLVDYLLSGDKHKR
eukprot:1180421-Prorocentrum_minimum.AAC.5